MNQVNNLFANIPHQLNAELFTSLWQTPSLHVERIVSQGHITPEDQWYQQAWDEWVLVLQGAGVISYEQQEPVQLNVGDYVLIPANTRHRVEWTSTTEQTIWLAIHHSLQSL